METRHLTPGQWRALPRSERVEILAYLHHQDRLRREWQAASLKQDNE